MQFIRALVLWLLDSTITRLVPSKVFAFRLEHCILDVIVGEETNTEAGVASSMPLADYVAKSNSKGVAAFGRTASKEYTHHLQGSEGAATAEL